MSISAYEFARPMNSASGYCFGVDGRTAAEALRKLAEDIESGACLFQSARVTSLASGDDFTTTGVRLVLVETKAKPENVNS